MTQELLDNSRGEDTGPAGALKGWWALFILGNLLGRGFNTNDTLDQAITSDTAGTISSVMIAASGALLVLVIGQIVAKQSAPAAE